MKPGLQCTLNTCVLGYNLYYQELVRQQKNGSKDIHAFLLRTYNYITFHNKRDFCADLEMWRFSGMTQGDPRSSQVLPSREPFPAVVTEGRNDRRRDTGALKMEEGSHEPRNTVTSGR